MVKNFILSISVLALLSIFLVIITSYIKDQQTKNKNGCELNIQKIISIDSKSVEVEIADNDFKRSKGLSGIKILNDKCGMLFLFDDIDHERTFWMKDMIIPIDILWIDNDKIIKIDKNVQPEPDATDSQLKLYSSDYSVDYVIELNAGYADRNNLKVGDEISIN